MDSAGLIVIAVIAYIIVSIGVYRGTSPGVGEAFAAGWLATFWPFYLLDELGYSIGQGMWHRLHQKRPKR